MISPAGFAIASMTVMLWIMWSDTIRTRRPTPILYAVRVALFLVVSGVMIHNLIRFPHVYFGTARWLTIAAVIIGLAGAAYFARKLTQRR